MKRIHTVKTAVIVKDTIPDEKIEILRDNCNNLRDRAMIDFLLSTGIRVGELVRLNIDDIDFSEPEQLRKVCRLNRYRKFWDMSK